MNSFSLDFNDQLSQLLVKSRVNIQGIKQDAEWKMIQHFNGRDQNFGFSERVKI